MLRVAKHRLAPLHCREINAISQEEQDGSDHRPPKPSKRRLIVDLPGPVPLPRHVSACDTKPCAKDQHDSQLVTHSFQSYCRSQRLVSEVPSYNPTIPIHHIVRSPTSMSYLRTKSSLPSSPMRNNDRQAGTLAIVAPCL